MSTSTPQTYLPPVSGVCRFLKAALFTIVSLPATILAQNYSENFNDGLAQDWTVASGSWSIPTGTDRTYDNTSSTDGPDISFYNGASWSTNYTYTTDVRLWGSGTGNRVVGFSPGTPRPTR